MMGLLFSRELPTDFAVYPGFEEGPAIILGTVWSPFLVGVLKVVYCVLAELGFPDATLASLC
jgi:hypothetical protein